MRLLCALGLFLALLHATSCLLIGAFNIQNFGVTKSGIKESPKYKEYKEEYEEAMKTITQIVQRYDIILIQEVRDPDLEVTKKLLALVNQGSPPQFKYKPSDYLGPPSRKERYLFLYRKEKVSVKDSFQYADEAGVFDRPPFVVEFSSTETGKEFVLIPIHTQPDSAVQEIDALVDVVDAAKLKWNNNNIMVLGDFNAGSNYVKNQEWNNIRLFTDRGFHWLIKDNVYTTMVDSVQVHDRIVVTTEMNEGVEKAEVFDFREAYNLKEKAKFVSDHFPVEVELKPEWGGELKREPKREPKRKLRRERKREPKSPKTAGKCRWGSKDRPYDPKTHPESK